MENKLKQKKISIMIVDDFSKIRIILKKMLETKFVKQLSTIYECKNGQEAIETFAKYKPDWIVMDLKMEIMDGLTASKEILKLNQDARIIILTQFDDEEYFDVAKEIGVKAFIQKENILDIPYIIENLNF